MIRAFLRSFSAGELTPELFGRLDFAKYQEGLATCRNFITLPHGPTVNRTGTQFVSQVRNSANPTRIITFSYNNQQVFALEVGAGYFRFYTNAQTLLYTTPTAWSGATAYNMGDKASSGDVNYYCIVGNTNQPLTNTAYWYALPSNPNIYEIPNPYAAADLMDIHYVQSSDVLTLTHPNYPPMELRRNGATNWQLVRISFTTQLSAPSYTAYTPSPITHTYVVTALLVTSLLPLTLVETLPSAEVSVSADLNAPGAKNTITWKTYNPGQLPNFICVGFNIYKKISGQYQYLGAASGSSFVDDIFLIPNPLRLAPTAGYISAATSLAATTESSSVSISAVATGSGTVSYSYVVTSLNNTEESLPTAPATCANNLEVSGNCNTIAWSPVPGVLRYNIYKLSYGIYGFIGQAGGTTFVDNNIVADISQTPLIVDDVFSTPENYPATVTYYQQRRCFAAPANAPQNVWMTRSGTESDMGYTIPTRDDNRIAFRIAAREASAIRHMVPLVELLALTASGEWLISSASGVLTPSTISVMQQAYYGASNVMPVIVGHFALYAAARGGHVRELSYYWQSQSYVSNDVSLLAPHLFDYNTILDMALAKGPIPTVWVVSSTGQLLGLTYVPDQQVAAWHHHDSGNGDIFESICTVTENGEDMLYCVVNRTINGSQVRYIERLHTRNFPTLADAFFVDSGATFYNAGTYTVAANVMTCVMPLHGLTNGNTCSFAFSDTNFGAAPTGTPYVVTVIDANTFTIPVVNDGMNSGTVTQQVTTISGLTWLEGCTVNILADGAVSPQATVTNSMVTLPQAAAKVTVGIPIQADLQTLPVMSQQDSAYDQGRPKNLNRVWVRVNRSSGILCGPDFNSLVPYKQRTTEPYGSPPNLISDEINIVPANAWGSSGQVCIRQNDPLPLDVVSMTLEVAMGGG